MVMSCNKSCRWLLALGTKGNLRGIPVQRIPQWCEWIWSYSRPAATWLSSASCCTETSTWKTATASRTVQTKYSFVLIQKQNTTINNGKLEKLKETKIRQHSLTQIVIMKTRIAVMLYQSYAKPSPFMKLVKSSEPLAMYCSWSEVSVTMRCM